MWRADSLEKTLLLGKIEGRRRRGRLRMRWLESITDSMDTNLSKFLETVEDRGAWHAIVYGVPKSQTRLTDWTQQAMSQWLWRLARKKWEGCPGRDGGGAILGKIVPSGGGRTRIKPETWESFDHDKWYAMRISWSVTLFVMLCLEPPKYNNTVLKFTFSLLKDGQRSKKKKKRN